MRLRWDSFINLLLQSLTTPPAPIQPSHHADLTTSSLTESGGPKERPANSIVRTTTRISSRTAMANLPDYEKVSLRIIDTPGLELDSDGGVREKERERGVVGLVRMLEERFNEMLKEESRIVRRQPRADDELVHLGE